MGAPMTDMEILKEMLIRANISYDIGKSIYREKPYIEIEGSIYFEFNDDKSLNGVWTPEDVHVY